jgi:hypothetical protein
LNDGFCGSWPRLVIGSRPPPGPLFKNADTRPDFFYANHMLVVYVDSLRELRKTGGKTPGASPHDAPLRAGAGQALRHHFRFTICRDLRAQVEHHDIHIRTDLSVNGQQQRATALVDMNSGAGKTVFDTSSVTKVNGQNCVLSWPLHLNTCD